MTSAQSVPVPWRRDVAGALQDGMRTLTTSPQEATSGRRYHGTSDAPRADTGNAMDTACARCDGDMKQCAGLLFPGARGTRPCRTRHRRSPARRFAGQCELHIWARGEAPRWQKETRVEGNGSARKTSFPGQRLGTGGGRYFNYRPPPVSYLPPIPDPNRNDKF